jgi:hypothetical protein
MNLCGNGPPLRARVRDPGPTRQSGGISEEQETYVRAWLQEFAARRQWLLEDREKILRAIWDGDLIL